MAKEKQAQPAFKAGDVVLVKDSIGTYLVEVLQDINRDLDVNVQYCIIVGPDVYRHYDDSYLSLYTFESVLIHRYIF